LRKRGTARFSDALEDGGGVRLRVEDVAGALAPFCRKPTLTVGKAEDAVSIMPLEELPSITLAQRSRLQ